MARTIQHKRGLERNLPTLKPGELAFTTDTKKVFIGSDTGNVDITSNIDTSKLATKTELNSVTTQLAQMPKKEDLERIGSASPKGAYSTVSDLQAAFPTGTTGVYLVTADNKWYFWNGTIWTVGGQYIVNQWEEALTTENEPWEVV